MGVSENIIEAAWAALIDSVEYKLLRDEDEARRQRAEIRPQRKKKTTKGKQENK